MCESLDRLDPITQEERAGWARARTEGRLVRRPEYDWLHHHLQDRVVNGNGIVRDEYTAVPDVRYGEFGIGPFGLTRYDGADSYENNHIIWQIIFCPHDDDVERIRALHPADVAIEGDEDLMLTDLNKIKESGFATSDRLS